MNKIHRIVWSACRRSYIVAHENAKTQGKPSVTRKGVVSAVAAALLAMAAPGAMAQSSCTGGVITVNGAETETCVLQNGDQLTVTGSISANPGVSITGGTIAGSIANSGTISGGWTGIYLSSSSVGSIANSGTISGSSAGIFLNSSSSVVGSITNEAGGLISGSSAGIYLNNNSSVGSIVNSGTISGGNYGIFVSDNSTINGDIVNATNTAQIIGGSSSLAAIRIEGTLSGSIINAGTISGGNGIYLAGANVTGGIENQSGGLISGSSSAGIYLASGSVVGSITNSGTISGSTYAIYVDGSSTLSGITITGNNTAEFIGEVYAPDTPVTLASGATYTMQNGQLFTLDGTSTGFTNSGTLGIAAGGTGTITGNYTQDAAATFRTHVTNDTTYGKLTVSGTATLPSNAKIDVNVADPDFAFTATGMADIISAGTLVSDGTFVVTDNSTLFNFSAVKDVNTVDLSIAAASTNGVQTAVSNLGNTPAGGVAMVLDGIIAGDPGGPIASLFVPLNGDAAVSNAASQTLPLLVGGSQAASRAALGGIGRVVRARMDNNRGLSSGDGFYGNKHVWMKPFGSWADQDDRKGVSGYSARAGGLVFGADAKLSDQTRLGLSFAYAKANVEGNASTAPNSAKVDVYQLLGYGSYALGNDTEINFQAGIGQNRNHGKRDILFAGSVAKSDYNSLTATLGAGIGRTYKLSEQTSFTPSLRADYTWIKDKGYTETGAGVLNLNVASRSADELILAVDGRFSHEINPGTALSANLGLGYDALNERTSVTATFAGAPGAAFTTHGLAPSPWLVRGGFGVVSNTAGGMEVIARYDAEHRKDFLNQTASVKLRWAF